MYASCVLIDAFYIFMKLRLTVCLTEHCSVLTRIKQGCYALYRIHKFSWNLSGRKRKNKKKINTKNEMNRMKLEYETLGWIIVVHSKRSAIQGKKKKQYKYNQFRKKIWADHTLFARTFEEKLFQWKIQFCRSIVSLRFNYYYGRSSNE